jgi:hypothetical protein
MVEQIDPNNQRLQQINIDVLTPLVQKALDRSATVTSWNYQPLTGGFGGGMGGTFLYRFSGTAEDQGQPLEWSMILKIIAQRPDEDPADPKYWKREYEFYRSGIFDHLPGRMQVVRCYGTLEFEGESCWLWLEELHDDFGGRWPVEHYEIVGRHAGHFNGAFLGKSFDADWLSTQWLHKTIESVTPHFPNILDSLEHPLLKPVLAADARVQYERLLVDYERFLTALDRLPQTIAHLDYFQRNAFAQRTAEGSYKTIAVDWAFAGQAAIGADAAMPVLLGLFMANIDPNHTAENEKRVFDGYIAGLRETGWNGSEREVRLGYAATTALRYIELSSTHPLLVNPEIQPFIEADIGCPISQYIHHTAAMNQLAYRMADEARTLL